MHDAELYTASHELQKRDAVQVLSGYISTMTWKPGDRVLDLGCGPGSVTSQVLLPRLPQDFGMLVGADVSPVMIKHARNMYTLPKLRFVQFDLSKDIRGTSELSTMAFDKIFSFYCLHWIPDQRYALAREADMPMNVGCTNFRFMTTCNLDSFYMGVKHGL
jgi:juvenile hormone acid methyltransferase